MRRTSRDRQSSGSIAGALEVVDGLEQRDDADGAALDALGSVKIRQNWRAGIPRADRPTRPSCYDERARARRDRGRSAALAHELERGDVSSGSCGRPSNGGHAPAAAASSSPQPATQGLVFGGGLSASGHRVPPDRRAYPVDHRGISGGRRDWRCRRRRPRPAGARDASGAATVGAAASDELRPRGRARSASR